VDPLGDQLLHGRDALWRRRHLDHEIRPVDGLPQSPCLFQRALGIARELGGYLEAHVAVAPLRPLVLRPQNAGRIANIAHGDALIERAGVNPARIGGSQDIKVIRAAGDGLLEDRRVGRDPADPVLFDQLLQLAADEQVAVDVVEPDRLAVIGQSPQRIDGLHGGSFSLTTGDRSFASASLGQVTRGGVLGFRPTRSAYAFMGKSSPFDTPPGPGSLVRRPTHPEHAGWLRWLPGLQILRRYESSWLRHDI